MSIENMKDLLETGEWAKLESAWLEALDADPPREEMGAILEALVEADKPDLAETLAWMLLEHRLEQRPPSEALDVARTVVSAVPASTELRSQAAALYRTLHGTHPHFDRLLAASGLTGRASPRRALRTLDTCLAIEPGRYLVNRFDGQAIQAVGYNDALEQFDLTDAGGHALAMEPKQLTDEFDLADETDFRVLSQHHHGQLAEMIKSDLPGVLIGLCTASGGRIDATALKEQLVPQHIAADKWSAWWTRARAAAKRAEQLALEGQNPTVVVYHPHGRTVEDELADEVAKAYTPLEHLDLLRRYVGEIKHRKGDADAAFTAPLMSKLAEQAGDSRQGRQTDALVASLAIAEMVSLGLPAPEATISSPGEIVARAERLPEMIAELGDTGLWPALIAALADRPDAAEQLARLLPLAPAEQLDDLAARLADAGRDDVVEQAVADALVDSSRYVEMCIWLWRGPAKAPPNTPGKVNLLGRLIGVLDNVHRHWEASAHRKAVLQRLRSALSAGGYANYKAAVAEMSKDIAATVKRRIERCDGLAQSVRENMLAALKEAYYSLFAERRKQVEPWADETTLWVTEASLLAREAELKEIVDVRMLANSRAIGAAAEHGDLSENSEWKYAIEERGRLVAQVDNIRGELNKARAIHPGDVPTDRVGIGSLLTLKRDSDGQELELRFLGPWDVDVANRVFSYLAPLAQEMMGKALGDEVEVKLDGVEGVYRIEAIASALA